MSERTRSTYTISQKALLEQAWSSGLQSTGKESASQITLLAKQTNLSTDKVKVNVLFIEKISISIAKYYVFQLLASNLNLFLISKYL